MNRFIGRPLKKLYANILNNITCESAIAKSTPYVTDEIFVVLDEGSDQRGVGGIAVRACHIVTG
jgi:hypothetical protein